MRVEEPALDLGVAVSLASSFRDVPASLETATAGEVGLAGEVRGVPRVAERLREAERLGFRRFVLGRSNLTALRRTGWRGNIEAIGVGSVAEALEVMLS